MCSGRRMWSDGATSFEQANLQLTGTLDIGTASELCVTSGFRREVDETWTFCPPCDLNIHTIGCRANVQILSKILNTDTSANNKHRLLYNQQTALIKYRKHSYVFRLLVYSHLQGVSIFKDVYSFVIYLCQL
jgi:hypothetical protein